MIEYLVDTSEQTAKTFGQLKSSLRKACRPIPENDTWIIAFALEYDLPLIGQDIHFELVSHLDYKAL